MGLSWHDIDRFLEQLLKTANNSYDEHSEDMETFLIMHVQELSI